MTNLEVSRQAGDEPGNASVINTESRTTVMWNMPEAEAHAYVIGHGHGTECAGWVFDGNTSLETYRMALRWLEDLDPELDTIRPGSPLSGEFADEYAVHDLLRDVILQRMRNGDDTLDDVCDMYEHAFYEAWHDEVERICRYHLSGEPE